MDISLCIEKHNNLFNISTFPMSSGQNIAIAVGVVIVVTSIINSASSILIIVAILSNPSLNQAPSYVLLLFFTGSNLGMAFIVQPLCFSAISIAIANEASNDICHLFFSVYASSNFVFSASILISLAIAVDRLLAVQRKMTYKTVVTRSRVHLVFGCIMAWSIMQTLISVFVPFTSQTILNGVEFMVCLLAITACYVVAYRTLNIHARSWATRAGPRSEHKLQGGLSPIEVFKYKKVLKTLVIVLVLSVMVYVPIIFYFMAFRALISRESKTLHAVAVLGYLLTFVVAAIIPLVYIARIRDLKMACFRILKKLIPWHFTAIPLETP